MVFKIFRRVGVRIAIAVSIGAVFYYNRQSLLSLTSKLLALIQPSDTPESQTQTEKLLTFKEIVKEIGKETGKETCKNITESISDEPPKTTQALLSKYHIIVIIIAVVYVIIFYKNKKSKPEPEPEPEPKYDIFGGLRNNSNFCYLNSMIQALASNEEVLRTLKRIETEIPETIKEKKIQLVLFIEVFQTINRPGSNVKENTEKLGLLMDQINWTKPDQQDAYELLAFFINTIEKSIKCDKKILMPFKLELVHTFSGINIPNKTQFHLGLSIGLCGEYYKSPGVTLNYLIKRYFAPTIIDDDQNKTSNLFFLGQPPNLLLLHIQANKWSSERGEMVKPEYHIQYEKDLKFDAKCYIDGKPEPESVSAQYKLTAIVHHMGTISGGHYITYRTWKGQWYLTNDEQVSLVDFNCNVCPYILLYEKS